ncbi:ROK family protein [Tissierellaceae bacterium HCP3S3_D8]
MKKAIGIDLGGTTIYGGLIDCEGNIVGKTERKTEDGKGREGILNLLTDIIKELSDHDILGIGIGSPGFIDSVEGKVLHIGGNIEGWANTLVNESLSKVLPTLPIHLENDANVAALCEHWIGAGKGFRNFVMLTLGTGVGGAIYLEKEGILKGHRYQGGELGHTILYPKGRECSCGQKGCVEQYVSGRSIERLYTEMTGNEMIGYDIFKNSLEDNICKKIVDKFCEDLAIYLVSIKNTFDPEGIIIGGGIINSQNYWWNKMLKYYNENVNDSESMKIVPAVYLNDAGMIGAGQMVFEKAGFYK